MKSRKSTRIREKVKMKCYYVNEEWAIQCGKMRILMVGNFVKKWLKRLKYKEYLCVENSVDNVNNS